MSPPDTPPSAPEPPNAPPGENDSAAAPVVEVVAFDNPAAALDALATQWHLSTLQQAVRVGGSIYDYLRDGSIEATYFFVNDQAIIYGLAKLNLTLVDAAVNPALMQDILLYNTIAEVVDLDSMVTGQQLRTNYQIPSVKTSNLTFLQVKIGKFQSFNFKCVASPPLKCRIKESGKIVSGGIITGNSIVYIIDGLVPPPGFAAPPKPKKVKIVKATGKNVKSPPPSGFNYPDILTALTKQPTLSIFYNALVTSGLSVQLSEMPFNFTVFAPTNTAFATLFAGMQLSQADFFALPRMASMILQNHIVLSEVLQQPSFQDGLSLSSMNGKPLLVAANDDPTAPFAIDTTENNATITRFDISIGTYHGSSYGTLHVIDTVLLTKPF